MERKLKFFQNKYLSRTVFTVFFCLLTPVAEANRCSGDYPGYILKDFFSNESEWTEVRDEESFLAATNKPVEFDIDLDEYTESELYVNGRKKGQFLGICSIEENEVVIYAKYGFSKVRLTITKLGSKLLKSHFKVLGFSETYYYRPDDQVE